MASQEVIQYITLVFKPELAAPEDASAPPASLSDVCNKLKAVSGVISVYAGRHHEKPERWTVLVRWSSAADLDAFASSAEHTAWAASLKALTVADEQPPLIVSMPVQGDIESVLDSPCVECFTAYGVDEETSWVRDRLAPFAKALVEGNLPGLHGIAYGSFEQPAEHGFGSIAGPAARGLLGWDTVEAHFAQRGEGKRELPDPFLELHRVLEQCIPLYITKLRV